MTSREERRLKMWRLWYKDAAVHSITFFTVGGEIRLDRDPAEVSIMVFSYRWGILAVPHGYALDEGVELDFDFIYEMRAEGFNSQGDWCRITLEGDAVDNDVLVE